MQAPTPPRRAVGPMAWLLPLLVVVLGLPAAARDLTEADDFSATSAQLRLPPAMRSAKIRAAREQWSWAVIGSVMSGYDSNTYRSPDAEGAGVTSSAVRAEFRRYLTDEDSLKFVATARFVPYWRNSDDLNEIGQELSARYTRHVDYGRRASFLFAFKHENDHATNIDGVSLDRDFEYFSYKLQPSVSWRLSPFHRFRMKYDAKHKDYVETPGLESLDWWKHGPAVRYERDVGETGEIGVDYRFAVQNYLEEPAAVVDGSEPPSAPAEEHLFHTAAVDGTWQPADWLQLSAGYRFRLKDDRYRSFESYDSHLGQIGVAVAPLPRLSFDLRTSYEFRDFESRTGDSPGSTLEYDRYRTRFSMRHLTSERMTLLTQYDFVGRDSNRSTGDSFRSYDRHRVLAGMSFAY